MAQIIVLVGFAEAMSAPESVWSLVDAGFRVVAFARKGKASALRHSKFVECHDVCPPEVNLQQCLADVQAVMRATASSAKGARLVLFPLDDKAVWISSKANLEGSWILAGASGAQADLALNKFLQVQAAEQAGLNVPKSTLARTARDLEIYRNAPELFPIILKAADAVPVRDGHVYSCRKWICADPAELDRAIAEWAERVPLLVQPFITGNGEGVFGIAARDGVRAWSGHRRLRMMNPQGSGSSACISESVPDELKHKIARLIAQTGWRGLFMVELLRAGDGKLWFVELNGRPWGSMALCRAQGLEYPAWHVQLALDETANAGANAVTTPGVVSRHAGREFMHILFVIKGAKSKALRNWPPFWKTLRDVLGVRKRDSFYNWRRDDSKVFLSDFYYTIHSNVFKGSA